MTLSTTCWSRCRSLTNTNIFL